MATTKLKYTEKDDENLALISEALLERRLISEIQSYIPTAELFIYKPDSKIASDWIETGIKGLVVCTFDSTSRTVQIHMIHPLLEQVVFSHLNVTELVEQTDYFYSFDAKVAPPIGSTETSFSQGNNWTNPLEFIGYNYIVGFKIPEDGDAIYAKDFYNTVTNFLKMKDGESSFNTPKPSLASESSNVSSGELETPTPIVVVSEVKPTIIAPSTQSAAHIKRPQSVDHTLNPQMKILHRSLSPHTQQTLTKIANTNYEPPVVVQQPRQPISLQPVNKKPKKPSLFSKLFRKKPKESKEEKKIRADLHRVSLPTNFTHVSHIAYSEKSGFSNLNEEWKSIFRKAGITEEELRNPQTAAFLLKGIGVIARETQQKRTQEAIAKPIDAVPHIIPPPIPSHLIASKSTNEQIDDASTPLPPPPPPPVHALPKLDTSSTSSSAKVEHKVMDAEIRTQSNSLLEQIRGFKWSDLPKVEQHIQELQKDEDAFASRLVNVIELHRRGRQFSPESDSEFSDA